MRLATFLLILATLLVGPSYYAALQAPAAGIYHDDAIYLLTSRSLATGHGYTIESLPSPQPQTKYPILFPALLAPVWWLFPDFPANLPYLRLAPLTAALAWFTLIFVFVHQQTRSPLLAAGLVTATAASPQVIFLSTTILSETLFAALTTACLLLLSRGHVLAAALAAAAAYHTRSLGIALIAACLFYLWRHGDRQGLLRFAAGALPLAAPWPLWQWLHPVAASAYLSSANYYRDYNLLASFSWPDKAVIAARNLLYLPFSLQSLYDFPGAPFAGFALLALAFRRAPFPAPVRFYLLASLALITLWAWPPLRFLVPLLPFALWLSLNTLPTRFAVTVLALLTLAGAWASHGISTHAARNGFWIPHNHSVEPWSHLAQQFARIRELTPPTALFQSNLDPTVYLYTGRHAIRGFEANASLAWYFPDRPPLGPPGQFLPSLQKQGVTHVFEIHCPWFFESRPLRGIIEKAAWTPLSASPDGHYRLYQFRDWTSRD
jgi:hypothetical protein